MSQPITQPHCMHCRTYWHFQFTLKLRHRHCEYSLHFYHYDKIPWPKSFVERRVYLASGSRRICKNLSWKESMLARARSHEYRSWTASRNKRGRIGNAIWLWKLKGRPHWHASSSKVTTSKIRPCYQMWTKYLNICVCEGHSYPNYHILIMLHTGSHSSLSCICSLVFYNSIQSDSRRAQNLQLLCETNRSSNLEHMKRNHCHSAVHWLVFQQLMWGEQMWIRNVILNPFLPHRFLK